MHKIKSFPIENKKPIALGDALEYVLLNRITERTSEGTPYRQAGNGRRAMYRKLAS